MRRARRIERLLLKLPDYNSSPAQGIGPLAPPKPLAVTAGLRVASALDEAQGALIALLKSLSGTSRAVDYTVIFHLKDLARVLDHSIQDAKIVTALIRKNNGSDKSESLSK